MEKEFIPYEQALALKELGFDEPCCQAYYTNGENELSPFYSNPNVVDEWLEKLPLIKAPLYQQAFRWFREEYGIHSTIHLLIINPKIYESSIKNDLGEIVLMKESNTYEKAELTCLKKLIEIVKQK
jgi:hypothetical protein